RLISRFTRKNGTFAVNLGIFSRGASGQRRVESTVGCRRKFLTHATDFGLPIVAGTDRRGPGPGDLVLGPGLAAPGHSLPQDLGPVCVLDRPGGLRGQPILFPLSYHRPAGEFCRHLAHVAGLLVRLGLYHAMAPGPSTPVSVGEL